MVSAFLLLAATLARQIDPAPQLRIYPQTVDCTGTLQACIDAANEGDIIDIATDGPIDEDLSIQQTLLLRPAPGFAPVIGGAGEARTVTLLIPSFAPVDDQVITLEGLTLANARIGANMTQGTGHTITIRGSVIEAAVESIEAGLFFTLDVSTTVLLEDNVIRGTGKGVSIQTRRGVTSDITIRRNRVSSSQPALSHSGIEVLSFDGATVNADIISNVVYEAAAAPFAEGIRLTAGVGSVINANIGHNTVYGLLGTAPGIAVRGSSTGLIRLFNNSVSAVPGSGYVVTGSELSFVAGGNHAFNNGMNDVFLDGSVSGVTYTSDPQFVDAASGNFALGPGSELVDGGSDENNAGSFGFDLVRNVRPSGAAPDVGALELGAEPFQFFTDLDSFTGAPQATLASEPYPGPLNSPPEPYTSGRISLDAVDPSTLFFDNWLPDPPPIARGGPPPPPVNELALNGTENLIIRNNQGSVFGMGIEFEDPAGGSTPSTFTLIVRSDTTDLGTLTFRTPSDPSPEFVGVWSPVAFDQLEFVELPVANENEFFGQVYTSDVAGTTALFADSFE